MAVKARFAAAAVAALLTTLTGCVSAPPTPSPTPAPSSSVAPSPTSTPLTPAEQDLQRARDAVATMWATYDRIAADPEASIGDMLGVATGDLLTKLQDNLSRYRAHGLTGSGSSAVEQVSAESTGFDAKGLPTWSVTTCVDNSNLKLVDKSGTNVVGPPYRIAHRSSVLLRGGKFLVSTDESTGTC